MKVGKLVKEAGTPGPFNGKVIEVQHDGFVRVAWWSDRLKDYDRRDSDVMAPARLEVYTVKPGDPGPAGLRRMLP